MRKGGSKSRVLRLFIRRAADDVPDETLLIAETEPCEGAPSGETEPSCSGTVDPARKIVFSGPPSFGGSESEVTQSYPTLCDPMDCSLPGSSIHGIFQARVLEWVAISFSRVSFQTRDRTPVFLIAGKTLLQADALLSHQGRRSAFSQRRRRFPKAALPRSSWGSALCSFGTKDPGWGGVIHRIAEPTGSFTALWGPARRERPMHLRHLVEEGRLQPGAKDFRNSLAIGKNHYFATWFVPG